MLVETRPAKTTSVNQTAEHIMQVAGRPFVDLMKRSEDPTGPIWVETTTPVPFLSHPEKANCYMSLVRNSDGALAILRQDRKSPPWVAYEFVDSVSESMVPSSVTDPETGRRWLNAIMIRLDPDLDYFELS